MKNQKDPSLSPTDEIKAENNVLKLKLGLEHGMQINDASMLSPKVENQWLKSVYAFEQQYKDAKRISLYDFLGKPAFKKWNTLTASQTRKELKSIQSLMNDNGVELDCMCQYDNAVIYKFITEELFGNEMDDIRIPGMRTHFIYEEFHPNHDYDLRRRTNKFVQAVFRKPWDHEFDGAILARRVLFAGEEHDGATISSIITAFQDAHTSFHVRKLDIYDVVIDAGLSRADVSASLSCTGETKHGIKIPYQGMSHFEFIRENDYWSISNFTIPGFTDKNK